MRNVALGVSGSLGVDDEEGASDSRDDKRSGDSGSSRHAASHGVERVGPFDE